MNAKRNYNSEQIVEIGKRIRARREALHLSQRQLADKINGLKTSADKLTVIAEIDTLLVERNTRLKILK